MAEEDIAANMTRYLEEQPNGITFESVRATDLRICYADEMGFMVNAKAGEMRRRAAERADAERCPTCGDWHDYTAKECENFLTFGQGGADFEESQRLAKLYDEEAGNR